MPILSYEKEVALAKILFQGCGVPEEGARYCGEGIAHSDFIGRYSHGLSRLTFFLKLFEVGSLNKNPVYKIVKEDSNTINVDCDGGPGLLSARFLYEKVLEKAKKGGIAMGTAFHGANIGCASFYGLQAVKENMICVMVSNSYFTMAPFGGADRLIGTNPIMVAVPAGEEDPICLDIATSEVAMGKILAYAREGKELAPGWAKDKDGNPTTKADEAFTVSPFGRHKGYGLAVIVDIFSAVLSGAAYYQDLGNHEKLEAEHLGFCFLMVDPSRFMDLDVFKARVDDYSRRIKNSRKAPGSDAIYLPGGIEAMTLKKTMETGYEISDALAAELTAAAIKLGIIPEGSDFDALLNAAEG